ncbi:hypothetical protein GCM10027416_04300 [Okibacterium endophyticum]
MTPPLLQVSDLSVDFRKGRHGVHRAVDSVSLRLDAGSTLGIVGESGSGKTTLARAIIGLAPIAAGTVTLEGVDITRAKGRRRRGLARDVQYVFQDPFGSLNPTKTIGQTLSEALHCRPDIPREERRQRVEHTLELVGMPPDTARRYPGSFSGGQRQRFAIARAVLPGPKLIICDEPTASLDLSIQAQILHLFKDLQKEFSIGYLFIAHNLDVVEYMSDHTMVMRAGRVVEEGPSEKLATAPDDPYTRALLAATPVADPDAQAEKRELRRRLATAAISGGSGGSPS